MSELELTELREVAMSAARYAGAHVQAAAYRGTFKRLDDKQGGETEASQVLTEVDLQSQRIIMEHLEFTMSKYSIGILAEEGEHDDSRLKKDYFWAVDPIDGTLAFVKGEPGYSVTISLINQAGEVLIGVVYLPFSGDLYAAIKNKGVLLNGDLFRRPNNEGREDLEWYADGSMLLEPNIEELRIRMRGLGYDDGSITGCGAVVNAIKVMNAPKGCYFKLPAERHGGGCIWDFAATALFFSELGLVSTYYDGSPFYFNRPDSIYFNDTGVMYATEIGIAESLL